MSDNKYNERLTKIEGAQLVNDLLTGYKIIWSKFDGWDWHLLVEQTDKEKIKEVDIKMRSSVADNSDLSDLWTWKYYVTHKGGSFSHMSSYRNQMRRSVVKKVKSEFYEDMFHKERMKKQKETEQ